MSGEDPTEPLGAGPEPPTDRLPVGDEAPTEARESWAPHQPEVKSGTGILVASILASLALIVTYLFAGGLDFKPTPVADPCTSRAWSDPAGLEDAAQQIAYSALDGAACDLGVSREELTRALATPETQAAFRERNGISDAEFADALRSGIERAADDAEKAGAISPLVASGIRTAVKVLPVEQLIPLIQDASSLLDGGGSGLGDLFGGDSGLGGLLDGLFNSLGGSSGSGSSQLQDQLPPEIRKNLPKGIEKDLGNQIQQGLQGLLNP